MAAIESSQMPARIGASRPGCRGVASIGLDNHRWAAANRIGLAIRTAPLTCATISVERLVRSKERRTVAMTATTTPASSRTRVIRVSQTPPGTE